MIRTADNESSIKYGELFMVIFFSLMFGMRMWGIYEGKPMYGPLLVVGFVLWGIGVAFTEHNVYEYLLIAFAIGFSLLIYCMSGEKGILLYFALMMGMKGINIRRLFKWGAFTGACGLAIRSFLAAFGLLEDVAYIQYRRGFGEVFRRSLGGSHPNVLSSSYTILAIMVMYLVGRDDKRRVWKSSAWILFFALYPFIYSGSQTGILVIVGFICLNLFYLYRNKIGLPEKIVLVILFPILWFLSIIGPMIAADETVALVRKCDDTLGSRWEIARYYLHNNGFTLFGQRLSNPESNPYVSVDMSQLYLLLQLGLVAFVVVTILWFVLICDEVKNNNIGELLITFTMLIMGITDPFLYNLGFKNLAFVFMGRRLWEIIEKKSCKVPGGLDFRKGDTLALQKKLSIPTSIFRKKIIFRNMQGKNAKLFSIAIVLFSFVTSVMIYVERPDARYVLADHGPGEHAAEQYEDLIASTYTKQEIDNIEKQGNIVLNYTDENEPMYIYYTSEESPVKGGYYAPNAAKVEKVRFSASIFFLGIVVALLFRRLL